MNTSGYGGRKLNKNIKVKTDDLKHPDLNLSVSGLVEKFATITPRIVRLIGPAGKQIKVSVAIVPEKKYQFNIVEARAIKGENISVKTEAVKTTKGARYVLTIENLKKNHGRYFDTVSVKTDSRIRPEIKIKVFGNIIDNKKKGKG